MEIIKCANGFIVTVPLVYNPLNNPEFQQQIHVMKEVAGAMHKDKMMPDQDPEPPDPRESECPVQTNTRVFSTLSELLGFLKYYLKS